MQFILFSSETNFEEEIRLVNHFLLDKDLVFHIRKPNLSFKELRLYIQKIPIKFHQQLVIHQHIDLLKEFDIKGYHCTRVFITNNTPALSALKEEYPNSSFSKSCHSLSELALTNGYSYVFISPIFNSISKQGYNSYYNLEEVNQKVKEIETPVFALGGISNSSVKVLKNSNFKGVAVLGYIWNTNTPKENYNKLKKALFFD